MKRAALIAAVLAAAAVLGWRLARRSPAASVSGEPAVSAEDLAKLKTLREILLSRNDNDPRLDKDFLELSPAAKELFRAAYRKLPAEELNSRGTIVFLLGRNLTAPEDWAFLREVAAEPPCLSMGDCSKSGSGGGEGLADDVTLAYPSLMALKSAEAALESKDAASAAGARSVIAAAKASKMPAVTRLIAALESRRNAKP